jgi:hypothetical protein
MLRQRQSWGGKPFLGLSKGMKFDFPLAGACATILGCQQLNWGCSMKQAFTTHQQLLQRVEIICWKEIPRGLSLFAPI